MKAKSKKTQAGRYAGAIAEAEAMKRGEKTGAKVYTPAVLIKGLRVRLGLSQTQFAARFTLPVGTIRDWENGRRKPEGAALALLRVIAYAPDVVQEALEAAA